MGLTQEVYEQLGLFYLGGHAADPQTPVLYDSRDLVTHAVCVGMTGSGKTGLCVGLLEEALLDGVPAIVIDPKGDIGNLLLTFPDLEPDDFQPWIDPDEARRKGVSVGDLAQQKSELWRNGLAKWGQDGERIRRLKERADFSIYTPGSTAGLPVSMLSSLAAPPPELRSDLELMNDRVSGTVTSILGLLGIDGDPLQTPEHIFVSNLVTHYWNAGHSLDLAGLIAAIQNPPISKIGVMDLETIYPEKKRIGLAMKINNLIASPAFASWMQGDPLDVQKFLWTEDGKPRLSIFSISHLGDRERMFFVSLLLNQVLGWMRSQSGTTSLRALVYMDEIFGYLPPVAEPPSKKPMLTLLKQARAFGVGLVLATQNPADIDYKALSNTGTWFLGRLQTERDRERVLDGLLSSGGHTDKAQMSELLTNLESRNFLLHNVHEPAPTTFKTRWVMSYLKGPLTREDVRTLMHDRKSQPVKSATQPLPAVIPEPVAAPAQQSPAQASVAPPTIRDRPPSTVDERFMAVGVSPPTQDAELLYRPMVYAWGDAVFDDSRRSIHQSVRFGLIHGAQRGLSTLDWGTAFRVDIDPNDFEVDAQNGTFMALWDDAKEKKSYTQWKKDVVDHIYRNETIDTWSCPKLKLKSTGRETGADFAQRVSDELHQKRDDAFDKVRDRYGKKLDTLQNRIKTAEDKLEYERDQASHAKVDTAVSVGTSILGMMFGRKSIRSASSSARSASKASKEARDVERAEEKLSDLQASFADLNMELEHALGELAMEYGSDQFPIETEPMNPKKKDISLEMILLVWVPYWVKSDGEKVLAVEY